MAHKHQYLTFYVHLTDPSQLAPLQAADGPYLVAPDGDPVSTYHANKVLGNAAVVPPCTTSEWYGTSDQFPTNVPTFDRKSGGWFGISWLFGSTTTYHWSGKFVFTPPAVPDPPSGVAAVPIQTRRWIDGFELPIVGEGGTSTYTISREASRHADGYGFAMRSGTIQVSHTAGENGGGMVKQSWERFYIRLRQAPTASTEFWRVQEGTTSAEVGMALAILPSGQVSLSSVNAAGVRTLLGSFPSPPLTLHQWYRIDAVISFGVDVGAALIYLDNVLIMSGAATGMRPDAFRHNLSTMGCGNANDLALDVDDWMNAQPAAGSSPTNYLFEIRDVVGVKIVSPNTAPGVLNAVDWINGSRMLRVSPIAFDAVTVNWAGNYRILLQNPVGANTLALTSSTSLADLRVTTDAERVIDDLPGAIGFAAIVLGVWSKRGANSGKLGIGLLGAVPTLTAIVESTSLAWTHKFTSIGDGIITTLVKKTPILFGYQKGSGADAANVVALQAVAEVLGNFGPEDNPASASAVDPLPAVLGHHNAPYPRTPWARLTVPGPQPIMVRAGTYTGNATGQDLKFPIPIHFLWIRPLTGDTGGTKWWSTMLASHKGLEFATRSDFISHVTIDPDFVGGGNDTYVDYPPVLPADPATLADAIALANQIAYGFAKHLNNGYWDALFALDPNYAWRRMLGFEAAGPDAPVYGLYATPLSRWNTSQQQTLIRICGADSQVNANAVVYAYLAIGDPGMRYMCNGQLTNPKGAVDEITSLPNSGFTPLAAFFFHEILSATTTAAAQYKGPGHATATASPLSAAQVANLVKFGAGTITSQSAFHTLLGAMLTIAYAAFRNDDGSVNGDTLVSQSGRVVQIFSYTGDGVSPRTIDILPASGGRRPVFAVIVPHGAASVMRDASHTGTTSTTLPATANAANGIRGGGIDQIIVGSDLNAGATVYDAFVVPGDTAGNADGWSLPGDFFPVSPDPPPGAPTPGDPNEPVPGEPPPTEGEPPIVVDPPPPTGPVPGLSDDLAPACSPMTHRICNLALTRLGITQQVTDLSTEQSIEATVIRACYADAMEATLRDFPWPFATRYATLTLATSTAPSSDWAYSYVRPSDCIFERRLVVARAGAVDPTPPPFQLSSNRNPDTSVTEPDPNNGRLFTNIAGAILEYTCRPKCPLTWSEPLFRESFAWRLAWAMAPGLSRLGPLADNAEKNYLATIQFCRDVIRPGNPGAVPATPTVDVSAAARTANVNLVNLALVRIGARSILAMDTDQSREAQAARLIFENELRATLRDFPWPFATKYVTLTLVDGDNDDPDNYANADWVYSYRTPTDLVFARRLVNQTKRRQYDPNPAPFRPGLDATGGLIYTDIGPDDTTGGPAVLEYTSRPEACVLIADALFGEALAWRLSASMAPSLAQLVPETSEQIGRGPDDPARLKDRASTGVQLRSRAAEACWQMYRWSLVKATVAAANEAQPDPTPVDADWIRGRE